MSGGVFAVARNIFEHEVFEEEPFTEREAWIWLIREAAWKKRRVRFGKMHGDLKRGQLASSVRFMAERWQWSKSRVHRFLGRLETEGMISSGTAAGHAATVITICNYDEYQKVSLPEIEASGTAAGQQRDSSGTNKNTGENISNTGEEVPLRGRDAAPADRKALEAELYRFGKTVIGGKSGGVITKLRKACDYDDAQALTIVQEAAGKHNPMEWLQGVLRANSPEERILWGVDRPRPDHVIKGRADREWEAEEAEIYRGAQMMA